MGAQRRKTLDRPGSQVILSTGPGCSLGQVSLLLRRPPPAGYSFSGRGFSFSEFNSTSIQGRIELESTSNKNRTRYKYKARKKSTSIRRRFDVDLSMGKSQNRAGGPGFPYAPSLTLPPIPLPNLLSYSLRSQKTKTPPYIPLPVVPLPSFPPTGKPKSENTGGREKSLKFFLTLIFAPVMLRPLLVMGGARMWRFYKANWNVYGNKSSTENRGNLAGRNSLIGRVAAIRWKPGTSVRIATAKFFDHCRTRTLTAARCVFASSRALTLNTLNALNTVGRSCR